MAPFGLNLDELWRENDEEMQKHVQNMVLEELWRENDEELQKRVENMG